MVAADSLLVAATMRGLLLRFLSLPALLLWAMTKTPIGVSSYELAWGAYLCCGCFRCCLVLLASALPGNVEQKKGPRFVNNFFVPFLVLLPMGIVSQQ